MFIKIDTREQELFKKCENMITSVQKFNDLKLVSETLPLGDIIINNGIQDLIIIERKTLSDLAASIKDGRYEEQSYRLNGLNHPNHNIVYLIEGDINRFNTFKERIDKQTLYSAMTSIHFFKGFSVMRSNSLEETAIICCNMAYKIDKESSKIGYYTNKTSIITDDNLSANIIYNSYDNNDNNKNDDNQATTSKEYCSVIKKVKKENITTDNIGEIMLCQIPGVSSTSALAILSQFKTLPNLIKSIQDSETCLQNVSTIDPNGKSRKISKTTIATIIKFLKN